MNKIIPATSLFILCSCSTEQIKTTDLSLPAPVTVTPKRISAHKQFLADRPRLKSASQYRHHTVLNIGKQAIHAANDEYANAAYEEPAEQESLIPRITRYLKRGIASWYGPGFQGKKTANGEIFNMYAMTAAHKTLPIPSYAEVTNLENHRSVIVRINDRGPFAGNRLVDLSYAAAKKLDIHEEGTGQVEVKAITISQVMQKSAE